VTFTSESAPADRWEWSFGDGGTASGATVTHMFSDTGKLFVQLIAYNSGCPDTLRKEEYVHIKPPIANFGFRYDCVNRLLFRFSDSSIGATSWKWTFGDGGESTDRSPSHAFARTGSYPVTLTVTNGNCSHSSTQTVLILPDQVQLVSNKDTACRGSSVTYSARNTEESMITSYSWTIGNGITQTTTSPSTRYVHTQSGRYDVTLVTTDIYGCQKRYTEANVVQINGADARFRVDSRNICTGLPVVFTDLSTTDGTHPITRWHWAFGDETETTYTTATPSITHTYQDSSRYSVRLTVTDAAGCTDDFYVPNAITTTRPLSGFTYRARTCPGSDNQFTNTSTQYRSLAWDFGDGRTSTAVNPVHAYADTGTFSVRLVATDARGCTDTTRFPVQVYRPQVSFSVKDTVSFCNPFEVNFRYTSTYLESFVWDLDGGTSRERNPTRFYTLPGTYRVKLTGRGFGGCVDSAKTTITLYDTSIALSYRASLQCSPFPVSFAGSSAVKTLPYTWDFGDGNISNSRLPDTTHVYNTYGDFVPKLLIFDPAGCPPLVAQGRDTIHVRGALVKFKPDRDLMCDSGLVQFTDSTTFNDDVRTYTWDFGDGQTAQAKDTSHFYDEPGEYRVSLNVRTDIGCSARMDTLIRVVRSPTVLIGGDSIICVNNSIDHLGRLRIPDTSQVQWTWQLPNGQSYGEQDLPVQRYDRPGTFPLTLTAVNSSGCRGTALKNIRVNPLPRADMPGTMTIQPGFPAVIPAQFDSNVVRYTWTPPAGLSCTDCPQPEASPKFNTKYVVDFEDLNGCRNSAEVQILVICKNGNVFVPNTFSPNGDGSNDLFYVRGKGLARVKALRVFNRWGEIVYEKREFPANDPAYGWNGRFRNGPPHPDVYVYQVEVYCENGEVIRFDGNVALIQ
jgi:gliding motility-associated-like protein